MPSKTRGFEINERPIGPDHPTYLIAELSANHQQDLDRAFEMVDAASEAGADAIKLQTYTPDTLTLDSDKPPFQIEDDTLWDGRTLYDLYGEAYTPWDWQPDLIDRAESHGLDCFSTPFDATAVEFLEKTGVPAFKIASFEITHLPLLKTIAKQGKPVIMSTGMATIAEIDEAVRTLQENGDPPLALLRCNSAYPARPEEMDLATIPHMMDAWHVPIGLSDHTLGSTSAIVAVTLGACIVEKHFTLDRSEGGPDSEFSMEPPEFARMVEQIRAAEQAKGEVRYGPTEKEASSLIFRESIFACKDIQKGEPLTEENTRIVRPGDGLPPKHWETVLRKKAAKDLEEGTPLTWDDIS